MGQLNTTVAEVTQRIIERAAACELITCVS